MRLAVLAHSLRFGGGLAVGQGILRQLPRVAPELTLLAVVPDGVGYEEIVEAQPSTEAVVYRRRYGAAGRFAYDELVLPGRVRRFRPHAILALNGRGLSRPPAPQVLFPQSAYLFYPRRHYGTIPWWRTLGERAKRRDLRRQLARCALALAQTRVVAARLRDVLGYRGPTVVCGSAVGRELVAGTPQAPPEPFASAPSSLKLFYPATYTPHKNLERVLDAYALAGGALAGVTLVTTVDPAQHPLAGRFLARLARERGRHGIVNVGELSRDRLAAFYAHSDALLMPSLIETAGLPYLEAMHFGKPILTSDLDFAREVCGDAAAYFDPFDVRSLMTAMLRFRDDAALRARLAEASARRGHLRLTSWDDVTRVIVEAVRGVASPAA